MELNEIEQEEIQAYFNIDNRISNIEYRIEQLRKMFYDQTMATRTECDGLDIYSVGFSPDRNVVPYLDVVLSRERTIEVLRKRKRYLNDYLNTLDPLDKTYLINRYTKKKIPKTINPLDRELYEEILEINEAINFMWDYPPDIRNVELNNETLEKDFDAIATLLGV
ncbi:hypothetical protein [Oceanobacillus chungangensis]|uniref:Uncharacterized protein n=1 Tax=Oceanobacillus chungangensis TaxID=1229152 RepID=A0A3D8PIN9_9BACI|nr:hypothetical protein [Oceanobacillus chungangensis]RDW15956.1 hypothetical protein CWR45_15790 [Oceanobacillus chungangensis]